MADFGLQGFPARPEGVDRMTHYRSVLEMLPDAFTTVWISDHFQFAAKPTVEGWTLLTYLAAAFPRFRYGHLVLGQSYRNPALLAKMAATLQELTGGRFILGLGAGWHEEEYRAYGYEYPETPERLRMLRESLQVIKAMWTQDEATFEGRFYSVRGAINEPKPVQRPHPPIWIGGGGEKVTLKLVAQHGDGCNLRADLDTVRHKLDVLREHCRNVGRDYDSILKTFEFYAVVGDEREVKRVVRETARRTGKDEDFVRTWNEFQGDPDGIAASIQEYAAAGIDYFIVNLPNAAEEGAIKSFAEEVFPRVGLRVAS